MEDSPKSTSTIVKSGFARACKDFSQKIASFGFKRTNSRSKYWQRQRSGLVDQIYFHRSGSSYGVSTNNSIDIEVHFSTHSIHSNSHHSLNGPSSNSLRDGRGYAYHLRFNALSWSTYERCLDDLIRITQDHGLPWFEKQELPNISDEHDE
jgi:hypothetical protein